MRGALRVLSTVFVLAYPVAVYLGLARLHLGARVLGLVLSGVLLFGLPLRLVGTRREHLVSVLRIPLTVMGVLLLGVVFDDQRFVLALPVLTSAALLVQFGASLRTVPIAERFARLQESELSAAQVAYCRAVTVTWCIFFLANGGLTAALALFAPLAWWTAYTGVLGYVLVGLLATTEYLVRKYRFRKYGQHIVDRAIARVFRPSPVPRREPRHCSVARRERSREPASVCTFDPCPRPEAPGVFDVHVPPELEYFRGHFPNEPILAGIVQLDVLVLRQALELWPDLTTVARIARLRFRKPIRPGDDLVLALSRPATPRVDFEITCRGASCAAGTLHFREPPAP